MSGRRSAITTLANAKAHRDPRIELRYVLDATDRVYLETRLAPSAGATPWLVRSGDASWTTPTGVTIHDAVKAHLTTFERLDAHFREVVPRLAIELCAAHPGGFLTPRRFVEIELTQSFDVDLSTLALHPRRGHMTFIHRSEAGGVDMALDHEPGYEFPHLMRGLRAPADIDGQPFWNAPLATVWLEHLERRSRDADLLALFEIAALPPKAA